MSTAPNSTQPGGDGYTGMPRWVKWTLIAALGLVVILVVVRLVVGGDHGPGRHMSVPVPAVSTALPLGR